MENRVQMGADEERRRFRISTIQPAKNIADPVDVYL